MIYLWKKMSFKQRDRPLMSLFLAPKTSERKSQFHSFSSILLICEQRHTLSNREAKDMGSWQRNTVTCSLVWASCNTAITTTKYSFTATAKFWAAPKPAQWNWHKPWQWHHLWKYQLEMASGFPHVRAGGGSSRPHIWLFWAWSNGQMMGHSIRFLLVPLAMHTEQLVSGSVILGFPLTEWLCLRTLLGFCAQGSPWCLPAGTPRQVWRSSCQLPPSSFPGFRKAKGNNNLWVKILHCQTTQ